MAAFEVLLGLWKLLVLCLNKATNKQPKTQPYDGLKAERYGTK